MRTVAKPYASSALRCLSYSTEAGPYGGPNLWHAWCYKLREYQDRDTLVIQMRWSKDIYLFSGAFDGRLTKRFLSRVRAYSKANNIPICTGIQKGDLVDPLWLLSQAIKPNKGVP